MLLQCTAHSTPIATLAIRPKMYVRQSAFVFALVGIQIALSPAIHPSGCCECSALACSSHIAHTSTSTEVINAIRLLANHTTHFIPKIKMDDYPDVQIIVCLPPNTIRKIKHIQAIGSIRGIFSLLISYLLCEFKT